VGCLVIGLRDEPCDASHELRTPLASMQLENEIFLRQKRFSEPEARAQIASNLEEVQRLESLASNLLDLTRYGKTGLQQKTIEINTLTDQAAQSLKKAMQARGILFKQEVAPAQVRAHEESVVQLLDILLDNAVKYGPQGGEVTLKGRVVGAEYVLEVRDQGPGVDPSDLPHIFDRLYRGDKARSSAVRGYGLGLALAQEIARANHAGITARNNTPEPGACFEVRLSTAS
jgi:signal transduction histidine kinase